MGRAAGAGRRHTGACGSCAEGRQAESLGGRHPDHAQWQIPVFDRAHHQQDRPVHGDGRNGQACLRHQFATEAQPRGIKIDPSGQYVVASGEKSDRLSVYKIDQSTGKLGEPSRYPVGNGANWVEIVDVQ